MKRGGCGLLLCLVLLALFSTAANGNEVLFSYELDDIPEQWLPQGAHEFLVYMIPEKENYVLQLVAVGNTGVVQRWELPFDQWLNVKTWTYYDNGVIFVHSEQPGTARQHVASYTFDGKHVKRLEQWVEDPSLELLQSVYQLLDDGKLTSAAEALDMIFYPLEYYEPAAMAAAFAMRAHELALEAYRAGRVEEAAEQLLFVFELETWKSSSCLKSRGCYQDSPISQHLPLPDFLVIFNDFGFFLEQAGQLVEAAAVLQTVLELDPDRLVAKLNLADVMWGLHLYYQAKDYYQDYQTMMKDRGISQQIPERVTVRVAEVQAYKETAPTRDSTLHFEDPVLIALVRQALEIPAANIKKSDVQHLYMLIANCEQIQSIEGIEQLTFLRHLVLISYGVKDLSSLTALKSLESLHLGSYEITDLSPLAGLTNLHTLYVGHSQVEDLTPLASLHHLQDLYLDAPLAVDLEPLAELKNLQKLTIGYSEISDYGFLEQMPVLEELFLGCWALDNFSPIAQLSQLKSLQLPYHQAPDFSPLAGLIELEQLDLGHSLLNNVSGLQHLTRLKQLTMAFAEPKDITFLAELNNLQHLSLDSSNLNDISPLTHITGLKELRLRYNYISDITPLAALDNLEILDLAFNKVSSVVSIGHLTTLRKLFLSHNTIQDISPLLANPGFGGGTIIDLEFNNLDTAEGSLTRQQIEELEHRGAIVLYQQQKPNK